MVMTGRACGVAVLVVYLFVCLIFILGVGGSGRMFLCMDLMTIILQHLYMSFFL